MQQHLKRSKSRDKIIQKSKHWHFEHAQEWHFFPLFFNFFVKKLTCEKEPFYKPSFILLIG